ncbi:MAG: sigma-70 family RNA polymerase sigma factor [Planctomycetes bacterium]|nr:sigma-70 family RNA polymerase sigma factor [Planctomycetota bacterium]
MDSRPSKRLVDHAAAGDPQALDQLFAGCQARLRRLLALKGGSALRSTELDDLVQEAYLEATRQFADYTYQGPDSFFRWLATVALNRLSNLQRMVSAQKRDRRLERPLQGDGSTIVPGAVHPEDAGPGPRTLVVGVEAEARLDRALATLSADDREVITLARMQGLSLQEIADRLGRTRNAVALLLSRALRKLKTAMGGDGVDE